MERRRRKSQEELRCQGVTKETRDEGDIHDIETGNLAVPHGHRKRILGGNFRWNIVP
jgi:hypothetical protein